PTKADQRLRGRRDGQSARLTKTRTKPDTTGTARITSKDVVLSCRVRRVRAVSAPSRAYHSPRPGPASRSKGRNLLCTLPRVSRKFLKNLFLLSGLVRYVRFVRLSLFRPLVPSSVRLTNVPHQSTTRTLSQTATRGARARGARSRALSRKDRVVAA